jgi:DNA-binding SARP family transcriptional activator
MLAIDRAEESAHRALMRIHANERHFGLALRQYELCRKALEADLGVEPDGETRSLYAEIVRRRSSAGPATRVAVGPALPLGQVA